MFIFKYVRLKRLGKNIDILFSHTYNQKYNKEYITISILVI